MSSTQHQLIEQCAIRLRGIVEALDNIHDSTQHRSPHRWSTDLDDVHSSAESLLALINDQAPALDAQGLAQPSPAQAEQHWPKLEKPAQVGAIRFQAGLSSRLVVEAAQRLYEFESTPEQEAERIERLQAFREQLDPLNLAPHAEAFNEAPDEALRPEQAEAERPEVVGYRIMRAQADKIYQRVDKAAAEYEAGRSALGYMEDIAEAALCLRNRLDDLLAAAPTQAQHSVPKAWLDVQAERRRQVENEGWTPEHDDEHSYGQMGRAAACYALAGSSAPNDGTAALLVSLAWPWDEQWWKPSTARRDLVKACALALAEIERLDRATATQGGPRDA
ncbi:hypothetical protein R4Q84_000095 [Pseudomonas aeruginosa]|uniref:hypothetical protein n=1 Tax=Pseudomonas aeruginosa TaxID=287 RepID=UPI001F044730|nr:hypothetical protein [Pseudomonas aeruginosa]